MKLNMLKLTKPAWVAIVIIAILSVSIAATAFYYYVVPHPARLRILYTHSDQMVNEVANGFKEWYGRPIELTLTLVDPQSAYEKVTDPYRKPEAEIWWGGPLSLFEKASDNLLPYNSTRKKEINTTVHSCLLMDPNQTHTRWYAASLYALGVMYNEGVLNGLNLSKPQTWPDLLEKEYEEKIAMTDPAGSEFTQPFIMLVIQSQNWTQGWEYLVKLAAFVKDFDNTEVTSISKVVSGYLPLAIVPDFYAYEKMAIPIPNIGFTYLDVTVLQPDPIAIIERGDYRKEAKAFVDYILTQEAQNIIAEYRLPIRQDATVTSPRINPFDPNFPYISDYNSTFEEIGKEIVKDYYQAWITQRHEQIKTAFEEITEANRTKGTNPNATDLYDLARQDFTYAGHYMNRTEIDGIYNKTNRWTENTTTYLNEWRGNSTKAYSNAIENAELSKQAVGPHIPFVAVYPYSFNNMTSLKTSNHYNYTDFLDDLDEIVELGFRGVKLWNVECFYDEGLLGEVMQDLTYRNLDVIIPFQFFDRTYKFNASETPAMPSQAWNRNGFPYNETQVNAFLDYVENVTKIVKDKRNLLSYSIHYPFNSSETKELWESRVQTPEYFRNLTSIIDAIKINDPQHPIYLVAELWEENPFPIYDLLPYNFTNVEGYGFQPYTTISDDINKEMIERLYRYFAEKGKNVYIDEWGVKTEGKPAHGNATTEENKSVMIGEFVEYIKNWKIVWCYFGLRDFPPEEADFGLIDSDHDPSREAMKEALTGNT